MRRYLFSGLLFLTLASLGCQGPKGPAGPTKTTYTALFQYSLSPNSSYLYTYTNWVGYSSPDTSHGGELQVARGPTTFNWRRGLLQFDISNLPRNAHIQGAYLKLFVGSMTIPDPQWKIGLHRMTCVWNETATWHDNGFGTWASCAGVPFSFGITPGDNYNTKPMDTFDLTSSYEMSYVAWNITPSLVQGWLDGSMDNDGLVLVSEGEGTDGPGVINFGGRTGPPESSPTLVVTYTIP